MKCSYRPQGVCSQQITFDLTDGIVREVQFYGGCPGNLQGIARLAEGMPADELIARLQGIQCGGKPTSCPDQFAKALLAAKQKIKEENS
ncbi:MAG: TIGR03905 family TSCPD domain-containing protein [Planctomycetaceae bacterium]|nr:TIGR03905 family TSCPD domain-containing protein [Planctomycetaceae bacterium]MBQ2820192.1 TIGR03905 family TSCPD domain-containing protein [Thermoguttaceae bacterium]